MGVRTGCRGECCGVACLLGCARMGCRWGVGLLGDGVKAQRGECNCSDTVDAEACTARSRITLSCPCQLARSVMLSRASHCRLTSAPRRRTRASCPATCCWCLWPPSTSSPTCRSLPTTSSARTAARCRTCGTTSCSTSGAARRCTTHITSTPPARCGAKHYCYTRHDHTACKTCITSPASAGCHLAPTLFQSSRKPVIIHTASHAAFGAAGCLIRLCRPPHPSPHSSPAPVPPPQGARHQRGGRPPGAGVLVRRRGGAAHAPPRAAAPRAGGRHRHTAQRGGLRGGAASLGVHLKGAVVNTWGPGACGRAAVRRGGARQSPVPGPGPSPREAMV